MVGAMDINIPILGIAVRWIKSIKPKDPGKDQVMMAFAIVPDSLIDASLENRSEWCILPDFFRDDKVSYRGSEASIL